MTERGITADEIDEILANPEITYASKDHADRTVILGICNNGKRLKIVVLTADPEVVITAADRDQ